jgi:hypothetical protein
MAVPPIGYPKWDLQTSSGRAPSSFYGAPRELYGSYDSWVTAPPDDVFTSGYVRVEDEEEYINLSTSALASSELPNAALMSPNPPAFDGRGSWFDFEEMVPDWGDSCILTATTEAQHSSYV